jgi:hypothetical protein
MSLPIIQQFYLRKNTQREERLADPGGRAV